MAELFYSFQAGEFFSSAQSSAAAQQREIEVQPMGERSMDSPLLLEQVQLCTFLFRIFVILSSFSFTLE